MIIDPYRFSTPLISGLSTTRKWSNISLSESDFRFALAGGDNTNWRAVASLNPRSSGKRVFEIEFVTGNFFMLGVTPVMSPFEGSAIDGGGFTAANSCGVWTSARLYTGNNSFFSYGASTSTIGTIQRCYIDLDSGKVWFSRNGTMVSGDPSAGTGQAFTMSTGTKEVRVGAFQSGNPNARVRLTAAQLNPLEAVPSGWQAWDS